MKMRVSLEGKFPMVIQKRGKWYYSSCPVLDLCTQGESSQEAEKNLAEAIQLFLISCFERGTLDQVLKDCGFVPLRVSRSKKRTLPESRNTINVSLPFVVSEDFQACPT